MNPKYYLALSLLALASTSHAHCTGAYNIDHTSAQADNPDWMKVLNDDTRISQISFPGTHDTMADCEHPDHTCSWGLHTAKPFWMFKCQSMGLKNQLDSGIRFLDIRIGYGSSWMDWDFYVYHGDHSNPLLYANMGYRFQPHVMEVVKNWLAANPSETVLMRLKKERNDNTPDIVDKLEAILEEYRDITITNSTCMPVADIKLGNGTQECDARGKIILMKSGYALSSDYYTDKWTPAGADQQDAYEVKHNWALYDKWKKVRSQLYDAIRGSQDKLYINYLSGSSEVTAPWFVASGHTNPLSDCAARLLTGLTTPGWSDSYPNFPRMNCFLGICSIYFEGTNILTTKRINKYDPFSTKGCEQPCNKTRVGIVISDYPGKSLINAIINANGEINGKSITDVLDNRPPVAVLSKTSYTADEGATITFDASRSSDPDGDSLNFDWDLIPSDLCIRDSGDGGAIKAYNEALTEFTDDFRYSNPNATDDEIAIVWSESDIGIAAMNDLTTAPDNLAVARYICYDDVDDGDGEVTVTVSDYFDSDTASAVFTILNVDPTVSIQGPTDINENDNPSYDITIVDPGTKDTFTVQVDWGDGSSPDAVDRGASALGNQTFALSHQFMDDNPTITSQDDYTISVKVCDDDGGCGDTDMIVTVSNVDPAVSIDSISIDGFGLELGVDVPFLLPFTVFTMAVSANDIGVEDTHILNVDWDDGSQDTIDPYNIAYPDPTPPHAFDATGIYNASLMLIDDDSGSVSISRSFDVYDACTALSYIMALPDLNHTSLHFLRDAIQFLSQNGKEECSGSFNPDQTQNALKMVENYIKSLSHLDESLESFEPNVAILVMISQSLALQEMNRNGDSAEFSSAQELCHEGDIRRSTNPATAALFYREAVKLLTRGVDGKRKNLEDLAFSPTIMGSYH